MSEKLTFKLLIIDEESGDWIEGLETGDPKRIIEYMQRRLPVTFMIPPPDTFEKPNEYYITVGNKKKALKYYHQNMLLLDDKPIEGIMVGDDIKECSTWAEARKILQSI
ncbi:hypothetical protein CSB11_03100 [Candidatus Campbellbacteria bacterium]|nr:MAG: hypothetical protein CSB11_03100 [Candidatus Campbellbacteria bacterium]